MLLPAYRDKKPPSQSEQEMRPFTPAASDLSRLPSSWYTPKLEPIGRQIVTSLSQSEITTKKLRFQRQPKGANDGPTPVGILLPGSGITCGIEQ